MKIFDWMHRKLHNEKVPYKKEADDFEEKADCYYVKQVEMENEQLLLQLDSTILTIGTFGYCNDYLYNIKEEEEEIEEEENEEELPEVINNVSLPLKGRKSTSTIAAAAAAVQNNKILKSDKLKLALTMAEEKVMPVEEEENLSLPLLGKKVEERKTLMDLFKESDVTEKKAETLDNTKAFGREKEIKLCLNKSTCAKEHSRGSNPKKLLSWKKGENSTNPKTLTRLITNMMRKKIYPEVNDVTMTEKRAPKQQCKDKEEHSDELSSLLFRSNAADKNCCGGGYFYQEAGRV